MSWTDERIALLRRLWSEGFSASEIARQIGSTTRCAVLGKVNRLGLVRREHKHPMARRDCGRPKRHLAPPGSDARLVRTSEGPPPSRITGKSPLPPPRDDDIPRKSLMELERGECRWRVDKPFGRDPYGFCGREALPGFAWCEQHAPRVYANWGQCLILKSDDDVQLREKEPA